MQRLSIILLICVLLGGLTIGCSASNTEESIEANVLDEQTIETDSGSFEWKAVFENMFKSVTTYVSIAGIIGVGVFFLVFKKDVPKRISAIAALYLFVFLVGINILLCIPQSDLFMVIWCFAAFVIGYIIFLWYYGKTTTTDLSSGNSNSVIEKKACSLINRLTKKSQPSIKSIQLYSVGEVERENEVEYNINFLGGSAKSGVNINALFSSTMIIPKEYIKSVQAIQKFYIQLTSDDEFSETEQDLFLALIEDEIKRLTEYLNQIKSVDDVCAENCYVARILLIYLSIYSAITESGSYIGLGEDSLGLNNPDLEKQLFTYERTGILSSVLFEKMPYVFSYRRGNGKNGRFYYTFSCGKKKKYIVMVTLTTKTRKAYINIGLSSNLDSIKEKLIDTIEQSEKHKKEESN